ncbi:MAG: hypothetical protein WCT50_05020 [Patescibacteria group bacterium]
MALNFFEKNIFKKEKKEHEGNLLEKTPTHLRLYGDKVVDLFCKQFSVEGKENIEKAKAENPEQKFIITAAHLHNLDVPAALKVFGNDFNIQMTGESVLLEKMKYLGHRIMINLAGRDNFTPIDYKENSEGKHGSFNPDNFTEIEEKMKEGKTPWIAAHPFALDGKMKKTSIGPVYLAAKTKSMLIPTALDISGGSVNLEGAVENVKALADRSKAVYHIGEVFKVPDIDVLAIDKVMVKRKNGERISEEELKQFTLVHQQLREQADLLGEQVAGLLPENKRYHEVGK